MIIDYRRDVNALDIPKTAIKIAVCLTSGDDWQEVAKRVAEALGKIHACCYRGTKEICKQLKDGLKADISDYITSQQDLSKVLSPIMKSILSLNLPYGELLNIAMTVARWPEYYLHTEEYLRQVGRDLKSHLSEINAITLYKEDETGNKIRICPYNPEIPIDDHDWQGMLIKQESSVLEFLKRENPKLEIDWSKIISADRLIQVIHELWDQIDSGLPVDSFAQGFVDSVRFIRKHKDKVVEDIRSYVAGKARAELFTLSESKSPISDLENVMQILHRMGFKKSSCPMVLENLFHCQYPNLGINPQEGQIIVDLDGECFTVAPGLGPGYKIRFVFNTHADVQNSVTPLADLIQRADKKFDEMEAYNKQMDVLLADLPGITDAFCTDSTGYSDYLTRAIYTLLLKMYQLPDDIINYILSVFSMPLLISGELYQVPYGAMQGCKLLVFIMNHANRLMGVLAKRLANSPTDCRTNAGDDVEAHTYSGEFTESDIATELAVFAMFNCPTNESKSAWLKRDGFFDFCSKYYARVPGQEAGVFSITGLPPKAVGKQILSINGFSELFKVMDTAATAHRDSTEAFDILLPYIREDLEDGCKLPSAYKDYKKLSLQEKIDAARNVSYDIGGICSPKEIETIEKLRILRFKMSNILERYTFDATGIFLILNLLEEDFKRTELYKALGTVHRQSAAEIIRIISILNMSEQEIDMDEVDWALGRINQFERNIIKGESISRNVSTYHRRTPDRDIDLFIPQAEIEKRAKDLNIPKPVTLMSCSMLLASLSSDSYVDIDNIKRYTELYTLFHELRDQIVSYDGPRYPYVYYALIEDGEYIRLSAQNKTSDYKHKKGFKHPDEIRSPKLKRLYNLLIETNCLDLHTYIKRLVSSEGEYLFKEQLACIVRDDLNRIGKDYLADYVRGLAKKL